MKLDRKTNPDGRGKYGLVNARKLRQITQIIPDSEYGRLAHNDAQIEAMKIRDAVKLLERAGVIDWGVEGSPSEFFVIKLRDLAAGSALDAYAAVYRGNGEDRELAADVKALADRAGLKSPFCKKPD